MTRSVGGMLLAGWDFFAVYGGAIVLALAMARFLFKILPGRLPRGPDHRQGPGTTPIDPSIGYGGSSSTSSHSGGYSDGGGGESISSD